MVAAAIVHFLEAEGKRLSEEKREGLQGSLSMQGWYMMYSGCELHQAFL